MYITLRTLEVAESSSMYVWYCQKGFGGVVAWAQGVVSSAQEAQSLPEE